jgi:hypothetical protein
MAGHHVPMTVRNDRPILLHSENPADEAQLFRQTCKLGEAHVFCVHAEIGVLETLHEPVKVDVGE